jgi:hypothetical protein
MDANAIRSLITAVLLLAFVFVFLQEAWAIWRKVKPEDNEARTYVWTAVSVLVGSVTAVALGVKYPEQSFLSFVAPPDVWRERYAAVYTIIGFAAVLTWFSRSEWASILMKNLATTFLGIAVPVVSGWLISKGT